MSRRVSFLVMGAASALGFAILAWASTAGSLQLLQMPTAQVAEPQLARPQLALPQRTAGTATQAPDSSGRPATDLTWIDSLLTILVVTAALIVVVLLARRLWANQRHSRRRRLHQPAEVTFEVLPEVSLALANDAPNQFAMLEQGSPRNAIVACWLRLEEVAGEAGVSSNPAETSTEFTTRVLGALAFDPAMINGFAALYREARFSRHELGEPARRAAVAALRSLYDDIGASDSKETSGVPVASGASIASDMTGKGVP